LSLIWLFKGKKKQITGFDQIPAKFNEADGRRARSEINKFINSNWNKEELPEEWKVWVVVLIYKKGDKTDCSNYRGISILPNTYKILSKILQSRLTPYAEEIIGDHQCRFRRNRSTIDHIFCIRQIPEKIWEYNQSVHQNFMDFKKAYDSVRREVLSSNRLEFSISMKLVRLIKMCLTETCSRVRVGKNCLIYFLLGTV